MSKHKHRIRLEQQIADLRAELEQLRAELATEIRTKRVVVDDDDSPRSVVILPGSIDVDGGAGGGCGVNISASDTGAEVFVGTGDVPMTDDEFRQWEKDGMPIPSPDVARQRCVVLEAHDYGDRDRDASVSIDGSPNSSTMITDRAVEVRNHSAGILAQLAVDSEAAIVTAASMPAGGDYEQWSRAELIARVDGADRRHARIELDGHGLEAPQPA